MIITPIPLWTAWDIAELPGNIPFASHTEAGNNWAVTTFEDSSGKWGTIDVYFWFFWRNPTQYLAVLGAESDLVLHGTCKVYAEADVFWGGDSHIILRSDLTVYADGNIIPGGDNPINSIEAHGVALILPWGHDDRNSLPLSDTFHVVGPSEVFVPGGSLALFAVHFAADYGDSYGQVQLDFESAGGSILCPSVQVNLLTAPPVAVA
jgi:hypothetical protein